MSKVAGWSWWPFGSESTSQTEVLVSVIVQSTMHPRGLSRSSQRILLTTSIWSVVMLVFVFFFTYTILLVYVDRPYQEAQSREDTFPGSLFSSGIHAKPKVKLYGRNWESKESIENASSKSLQFGSRFQNRNIVWNPVTFFDVTSMLPECKHKSLFIVIITSSPDHFEHRREIRETWCDPTVTKHKSNDWQCVFLIGQVDNDALSSRLKEENKLHKDILRGSYVDSYRNLTHKVMHGLTWASTTCQAPYVLKTDDDCFVSTELLWQFLLHHNLQTTGLYAGNMVLDKRKLKVIRRPNEKWSVDFEDYSLEYYPPYASGSGYALSFDVVSRVVEESHFIKPIPNEDAYLGLVIAQLGITPTNSGRFTLSSMGLRLCNYMYVFVVHDVRPNMHKDIHDKMMAAQTQCKDEDEVTSWY